ncbi:bifunctional hydroxymethylpyrimidine kinase/phosphomethylpyrimidine kinase [Halocynthiibacter sp. C4]|uniref:bifunctional hydroxymethylpyrimidine kinase/phosphomethylpyrimidine kinase n=1 Tax=Halocynthiibacter sp. C4 TaxID=2992758 RepID=UPI00237BE901|nr:bifunctional hydroxymethylpyrimidine kinase/phosphomethylpyrimidine kinase [Halocynthiibacter sp. C4]MDE0590590.1 bifunctional hydroxymethylpyrimidine kinase/phosphomethylpyrimidine kinase [Halocynthiibacter sp. C4]
MQDKTTPPIALTIAGSDSGGGAGIQADLKAFSANEVYGTSVITAVTAQNTCAVTAVHEIPADVVAAQIRAVLDDMDVGAIKLGMLFSPEIIHAVADALRGFDGPLVVDPVMIAKSGDRLLQSEALAALKELLLPRADVLTPNLPEAAVLLGTEEANCPQETLAQAEALTKLGPKSVLLKGGHGKGEICEDILLSPTGNQTLAAARVHTQNTHGTGCTYAATIAANLAKGLPLNDAVKQAHGYLQKAILAGADLSIGKGHGPVHHFAQVWAQ